MNLQSKAKKRSKKEERARSSGRKEKTTRKGQEKEQKTLPCALEMCLEVKIPASRGVAPGLGGVGAEGCSDELLSQKSPRSGERGCWFCLTIALEIRGARTRFRGFFNLKFKARYCHKTAVKSVIYSYLWKVGI